MNNNDEPVTEVMGEKAEISGQSDPPPMPQLLDGIGLNLEQVANLLAEKHKIIVSPDDPILMTVTLLNAFLAEENRIMERHKGAMAQVLASRTDKFVRSVSESAASVSAVFSGQAVAAMKETVAGHNKGFAAMERSLARHQANIRWWAIIALVSAVVNVGVFVWQAIR